LCANFVAIRRWTAETHCLEIYGL